MNQNKRQSLYVTLGVIIVIVVTLILSIQSAYNYGVTKDQMILEIEKSSMETILSLEKNIANLMSAYAVHEYGELVLNEMIHNNSFAIIVEDINMGKILGEPTYISGKIRNKDNKIIDFDPNNLIQKAQLEACYFSEQHDVTGPDEVLLGKIRVYITSDLMNRELNEIISSTLLSTATITLLLVLVLFTTIRRFILKPISNIIFVINDRDIDGIPRDLVPHGGALEVFSLSNTINKMITSVRASRVELEGHHEALSQQKVALDYQAHHDALTGLANRVLFSDRLENSIAKSNRDGTKMALLFIDLDHFKEINDSYGHKTGDEVLKIVTQRLSDVLRNQDALSRLGGDEFTVIAEGLKDGQAASVLAAKILETLSKEIMLDGKSFYVSCSIGISLYPEDGSVGDDLLKYADAAMYRAKDEGRNNFQYYSSDMTELAFERVVMETNLREAFKNDEFIVYYQAQVDARNESIVGMEALVRWQNPSLGLVSPAKFIPLAEAIGLIVDLDRFVMRTAMTQQAIWYEAGLNPGVLAMNLAVKQLQQDDFIETLEALMQTTGCQADWIALEVMEGQIMANPEQAIKSLTLISEIGIEIAVDDFGTGYSSLSYLKKLPINKLKIDQSFVRNLPDDDEDVAITKAVIALARSLNHHLIAEGVETKEQKDFLLDNGCDHIQGYYYAKPMPEKEMTLLLQQGIKKA
jgi:diguanylate cyclase (GGDEF)-like protein